MPLKPKTARRNRRSFPAARLNRHAFASVGTDREIRGLRPSGRTLESTRCSLRCLCHRSLTRGPSIFSEEIDDMLTSTGLTVLKTPVRVPKGECCPYQKRRRRPEQPRRPVIKICDARVEHPEKRASDHPGQTWCTAAGTRDYVAVGGAESG
jgi:hypothetical protein